MAIDHEGNEVFVDEVFDTLDAEYTVYAKMDRRLMEKLLREGHKIEEVWWTIKEEKKDENQNNDGR